jgi:hypothetical protein
MTVHKFHGPGYDIEIDVHDVGGGTPSQIEQLTQNLIDAALRWTFRNTLRPQKDADQKLDAIARAASAYQVAVHPDKQWDTGI